MWSFVKVLALRPETERLRKSWRNDISVRKAEQEEFPPRQKPASFNIGDALEKARQQEKAMARAVGGGAKSP
jgi:hypothetical protein